ncbi:hypothetical protein Hanom_Chr06g00530441 [Helianthus anomalus]
MTNSTPTDIPTPTKVLNFDDAKSVEEGGWSTEEDEDITKQDLGLTDNLETWKNQQFSLHEEPLVVVGDTGKPPAAEVLVLLNRLT